MSENLNRSNPDFSKYDSMSIGELEEILCADAQGPERDDSDVDEILYVMEVLAKKRRQNGIAGKTALEAYQEFQQHYLPAVEEENIDSIPKRKSTAIPFRRIATIAASLVLVFTLSTSVNAFGWKDIWNAVARWAEETFSFSMGVGVSEPTPNDICNYLSLSDALEANGRKAYFLPTRIPERFSLDDIVIDENPIQETYIAIYICEGEMLKLSVRTYRDKYPEQIEMSSDFVELYSASGTTYYLFSNQEQNRAVWITGEYECNISGSLDVEEIKTIIDSIEKG